jgi:hypothetical protein
MRVESVAERAWNTQIALVQAQEFAFCDRGAGPLVGAQLRYLIASEHGYLGGFAFSAAALALAGREAWIGWDAATRRAQLHRVVNLSRFLIRERGCHNLASQVMGRVLVLRRLADDFAARFGYRPYLVESFVDTATFEGICYRASKSRNRWSPMRGIPTRVSASCRRSAPRSTCTDSTTRRYTWSTSTVA